MTSPSAGYLLDNAAGQTADRWGALADLYDEATVRHLTRLGVGPGWSCLEVGAGGGTVARWLAHRVAPGGIVTATDLDTRWLDHLTAANLDVVRHDLAVDPLPEEAYDLVHVRLVLGHLPDPEAALTRLVAATRPGGWLLVEEYDLGFGADPCPRPATAAEHRANRIRAAFVAELRRRGSDLELGYRMVSLLREQGLTEVQATATVEATPAVRVLERSNCEQTRPVLEAAGIAAADLDAHLRDLDQLVLAVPALVSVSARRSA